MKTPRKRGAYFTGLPTQQLFGPFNKVFDGKAEVLEHGAGGCRFAEGIDANDIAIKADERSPVVADSSLDGDALAQFRRQHGVAVAGVLLRKDKSEEHTSELQSLMRISSAVFCLKKK